MTMPRVTVYQGLSKDLELAGPGVATFDADGYDEVRFVCSSLSITKSSSNASELEVLESGATLLLHLVAADIAAASPPADYFFQLQVRQGAAWFDVGGQGVLMVRAAA